MLPFPDAGNLRGRGWPRARGRHSRALRRRAHLLIVEHTIGIVALLCRTVGFQRPACVSIDKVWQRFKEGKELLPIVDEIRLRNDRLNECR